jgi:hypothetical protein
MLFKKNPASSLIQGTHCRCRLLSLGKMPTTVVVLPPKLPDEWPTEGKDHLDQRPDGSHKTRKLKVPDPSIRQALKPLGEERRKSIDLRCNTTKYNSKVVGDHWSVPIEAQDRHRDRHRPAYDRG